MIVHEQISTDMVQTLSGKTVESPAQSNGDSFDSLLSECTANEPTAPNGVATASYSQQIVNEDFTGEIDYFGGGVVPANWLLCDGQTVSRTQYAALFDLIGERFGAGDGSTTFNVPDFRSRSPLGVGQGTGLTDRPLGGAGGEESHQVSIAEMASHAHDLPSGGQPVTTVYSTQFGMYLPSTWGLNDTLAFNGGGGVHNTLHPFLTVAFIIRA